MSEDMVESVFSLIGLVSIAGGGGAAVAYGIFRFLGQSWIENKFAKDLEAAKTELSVHADRRMKLHDKEYEVFPETWSRLNTALNTVEASLNHGCHVPDFEKIENPEEFLRDKTDFSDDEIARIISSQDMSETFAKALYRKRHTKAQEASREFRLYFLANRIFLDPELKEKLSMVDDLLFEASNLNDLALRGREKDPASGDSRLNIAEDKCKKEIRPLMEEIERLVQKTLFP